MMHGKHEYKANKTSFDIKSIIGNCDRKHDKNETVENTRSTDGPDRNGRNEYALKNVGQTDRKCHSMQQRFCTSFKSQRCFERDNVCRSCYDCSSPPINLSSSFEVPRSRARIGLPMSMPLFSRTPGTSISMCEDGCREQRCFDARGQEFSDFSRCSASKLSKTHQYLNAADRYKLFQSYPPSITRDLHPRCLVHPDLIPQFPGVYPRPDLIAAHHGGRRIRTTFTRSQLKTLEKRFKSSHYIVGDERKQLAQDLGLNESQVKIWFQNRRTKFKQDKEFEELGKSKVVKKKGEHHVKKWQMETKYCDRQETMDSDKSQTQSIDNDQSQVINC